MMIILTPTIPTAALIPNTNQNLCAANHGVMAVNMPDNKNETKTTMRPPIHSDIVPPMSDVLK